MNFNREIIKILPNGIFSSDYNINDLTKYYILLPIEDYQTNLELILNYSIMYSWARRSFTIGELHKLTFAPITYEENLFMYKIPIEVNPFLFNENSFSRELMLFYDYEIFPKV